MAISYPSLRGSQDPWQSSVVLCIFTKVDPHVVSLLGMTESLSRRGNLLVSRHQVAPVGVLLPYQHLLAPSRPTLNLLFACYRRHHRWMLLDKQHYVQIVTSSELRAYAVAMFEHPFLDVCRNTRVQDRSIRVSQYVHTRFHHAFHFSFIKGRSPRRYAPRDDGEGLYSSWWRLSGSLFYLLFSRL